MAGTGGALRARASWAGAGALAIAGIVAPARAPGALWSAALADGAAAGACGLALIGAARLAREARRPWLLVAAACACFFVGDVIWDVYEHGFQRSAPLPSLADVAYLAAYPLLTAAVLDLLRRRTRKDRVNAVLESSILAIAFSLVLWEPVLLKGGRSVGAALVAGAYPVLDLFVIGLISMLFVSRRPAGAELALCCGALLMVTADVFFLVLQGDGSYATGSWPDPLYVLAPMLLAGAVWFDDGTTRTRRPAGRAPAGIFTMIAVGALVALPVDIGYAAQGARRPYETAVRVGLRIVLVALVAVRVSRQAARNQRLVAELNRSSSRLAMVMDSTADAVIFASPRGIVLEWNAAAERLFGVPRERAIGTNAMEHFVRPESAQIVADAVADSHNEVTETTLPLEIAGRVVPVTVQIAPVIDPSGELAGYVSVSRDDTQRLFARHARQTFAHLDPEFAVERFAEELSTFVPFDLLSLASVDDDHFRELARVARVGGDWEQSFVGVGEDQLVEGMLAEFGFTDTQEPYILIAPEDLGEYGARVDTSTANAVISLPLREPRSGAVRGFLTLGFANPADATVEHAEALARVSPDIAQSVQNMILYEQQALAADRLRELNELRDGFLAMVAHEVRGPLSGIGLAATVLEEQFESIDATQAKSMLAGIASSARQLTRLTGDLVAADGRRDEADGFRCDIVEIDDVGRLVADAAAAAAGPRRDRVHTTTQTGVGLRADPDRLAQIVTNLVTNALKFTRTNVEIALTSDGSDAVITVADHGPGIAGEHAHRMFQRYARLVPATSGASGSGLGLYITRELVLAHGGRIAYRDTPGGGATFEVTLPNVRVREPA